MSRLHFYALRDDLLPALQAAERLLPVDYFEAGLFDHSPSTRYGRAADLPQLGEADFDSSTGCRTFLMRPSGRGVEIRQTGSGFAIDQLINPASAILTPAGVRGAAVLSGQLSTVHDDEPSRNLTRIFGSAIRKRFHKAKSFWIGEGAMAVLKGGGRLTQALQSPTVYDLTL
jgi:hypothetical protein